MTPSPDAYRMEIPSADAMVAVVVKASRAGATVVVLLASTVVLSAAVDDGGEVRNGVAAWTNTPQGPSVMSLALMEALVAEIKSASDDPLPTVMINDGTRHR